MLLTGQPISAEKAKKIGLINDVLDDQENLDLHVTRLSRTIASKSPSAVVVGLQLSSALRDMSLDQAYAAASETMVQNLATQDAQEGIAAFLGKRPPTWV